LRVKDLMTNSRELAFWYCEHTGKAIKDKEISHERITSGLFPSLNGMDLKILILPSLARNFSRKELSKF
jgi:hypothetical protein